jgi:hypothetical protein
MSLFAEGEEILIGPQQSEIVSVYVGIARSVQTERRDVHARLLDWRKTFKGENLGALARHPQWTEAHRAMR